MSPLASAPVRGYADWQRVGNYDTDIQWSVPGTLGAASVFSPVIDVSRFAYLGGRIGELSSQCAVTAVWWNDPAATIAVGAQTFQLDHNIQNLMQLRLPNLGPFVSFTINNINGVAFEFFARILVTNRPHPLQIMPDGPVVVDHQNEAVAAAGTLFAYPTDYYAGPVSVWVNQSVVQSSHLALQYLDISGGYHYLNEFAVTAADNSYSFIVPSGAWRLALTNGVSAQNVYVSAVHSLTGAA